MLKNIFVFIFSFLLIFSSLNSQTISGQTDDNSEILNHQAREAKWIRHDLKVADFVAYVDAKKIKTIESFGDADCENNTGSGYCSYLITAEVKESYKGNINERTLEFYVRPGASFPKKILLGEQVVFLVSDENDKTRKHFFSTIENSTRDIEAIKTIRQILDPQTPVDENDEFNPYSLRSLKKDFEDADAVLLIDVQSFSKASDDLSPQNFIIYAHIKGVFKGNFEVEEKLWYRDDLLHRPFRAEDLGRQIVFLERKEKDGKTFYTRIPYAADKIQQNVLEKLKKISDVQSFESRQKGGIFA